VDIAPSRHQIASREEKSLGRVANLLHTLACESSSSQHQDMATAMNPTWRAAVLTALKKNKVGAVRVDILTFIHAPNPIHVFVFAI